MFERRWITIHIHISCIRIHANQQQNELNKKQYAEDDGDEPKNLVRRRKRLPPLINITDQYHYARFLVMIKITSLSVIWCPILDKCILILYAERYKSLSGNG